MIKATALYGHPADPAAFEKYYSETHLPIARRMPGVLRMELTKFLDAPDGAQAPYYRMVEFYFSGIAEMQQSMGSAEGQATAADLANFASGGVRILIGVVE